jgi:hypothetical protein
MEIVLLVLICGGAVWYLYRHFVRSFKTDQPSCSCDSCNGCPAAKKPGPEKTQ